MAKRVGILVAVVLAFSLLMVASRTDDLLARSRRSGRIRVGFASEAPYGFVDDQGRVTGAFPEVARAVLSRMGIPEADWVLSEFGTLADRLNARRIDIIAAGMYVTDERSTRMLFSIPVTSVREGILTRNDSKIASLAEGLGRPDYRFAYLAGAVEESLLIAAGCDRSRLHEVPDARSGVVTVERRAADAMILSLPTVRFLAGDSSQLVALDVFGDQAPPQPAAFAFRFEDSDFVRSFNNELAVFMRTEQFAEILNRFGFGS